MFKKIGSLLVTVLGVLLLVYSASRSLDFITLTLPADRQILAYFGLAALDGGLVCWLLAYLYGCKGGWQQAVALLMVIIDLVGAVAMFTLDTLYNTGKAGMTAQLGPQEIQTAVLALSGVVALNIASTIAHHLLDPDKLREHAEQEAFSRVEEKALQQITKDAESLAAPTCPDHDERLDRQRTKPLPVCNRQTNTASLHRPGYGPEGRDRRNTPGTPPHDPRASDVQGRAGCEPRP